MELKGLWFILLVVCKGLTGLSVCKIVQNSAKSCSEEGISSCENIQFIKVISAKTIKVYT